MGAAVAARRSSGAASNFAPHEKTFVEVAFEPADDGTLVTRRAPRLERRSATTIPARHGLEGAAFCRMIGLWWGELMTSLREHAAARG